MRIREQRPAAGGFSQNLDIADYGRSSACHGFKRRIPIPFGNGGLGQTESLSHDRRQIFFFDSGDPGGRGMGGAFLPYSASILCHANEDQRPYHGAGAFQQDSQVLVRLAVAGHENVSRCKTVPLQHSHIFSAGGREKFVLDGWVSHLRVPARSSPLLDGFPPCWHESHTRLGWHGPKHVSNASGQRHFGIPFG